MEWLSPLTALYAALVSLPLLFLLYFLKLKRIEQPVSSTFLWKRAVQDLQVNAPFQRLRRNILLLLQLLTILAILTALAGPVISMLQTSASRYVILIDRSASMNATDVEPSRLAEAKTKAKNFVESLESKTFLSFTDKGEQVMVIAFDDDAKVMCNFTTDKRQLLSAIENISPGDGGSSLSQAIVVARAFAQPGANANNKNAETPAQLILFSDGQIQDTDQVTVSADEIVFNRIGKSKDNIAVIAMKARRSYENPQEVNVFATIAGYADKPSSVDVQLSIEGNVRSVKRVNVPAAAIDPATDSLEPGKVAVTFTLEHEGAGVLEVRQMTDDFLAADDAAWAVLSSPEKVVVLLITENNPVIENALKACPIARLDTMTPAEYSAIDESTRDISSEYDIIVLDRFAPEKLPPCSYLMFSVVPPGEDIKITGESKNQFIIDWRSRHAVLKYVNPANLYAATADTLVLPREAEVLAEFNETPAIRLLRSSKSTYLVVSFDVLESNRPFETGFVMFFYNATSFLAAQRQQSTESNIQVGQPITITGIDPGTSAFVKGPGIEAKKEIQAAPSGVLRLAEAELTGVYSIDIPETARRVFAVNLTDSKESNIAPLEKIILSGTEIESEQKSTAASSFPLWSFLVFAALILVCCEWLIYNFKVRI